jgi:hypothetical protein
MPQGKGTKRPWAPAAPVAATSDDTKHASTNEQSVATEERKSSDEMESRAANDEDNGPQQALQLTAIDSPPTSSTPSRRQQLQGDRYGGASNQDLAGIQALASILRSSDQQVSKKTSRFVCMHEETVEKLPEEAQERPREGDGSSDLLASSLIQPPESILGMDLLGTGRLVLKGKEAFSVTHESRMRSAETFPYMDGTKSGVSALSAMKGEQVGGMHDELLALGERFNLPCYHARVSQNNDGTTDNSQVLWKEDEVIEAVRDNDLAIPAMQLDIPDTKKFLGLLERRRHVLGCEPSGFRPLWRSYDGDGSIHNDNSTANPREVGAYPFDPTVDHVLGYYDDNQLVAEVHTSAGQSFFMGNQLSGSSCLNCGQKQPMSSGAQCCGCPHRPKHGARPEAKHRTCKTFTYVQDWIKCDVEALARHDYAEMVRLGGDTEPVVCSAAVDAEFHRLATAEEDTWSKWSLAESSRGGVIGGTMSVERQKAKPPRPEYRRIILKFGPNRGKAVTSQHEVTCHKGGTESRKKQRAAAPKTEDASIILMSGEAVTNQLQVSGHKGGTESAKRQRVAAPKTEDAGIINQSTGEAAANQLEVNTIKAGTKSGVIRRLQRAQQDELQWLQQRQQLLYELQLLLLQQRQEQLQQEQLQLQQQLLQQQEQVQQLLQQQDRHQQYLLLVLGC